MGIYPSKPSYSYHQSSSRGPHQVYRPQKTFRLCTDPSPSRCICPLNGRPYRHPKWWILESLGNQGSRLRDPMDILTAAAALTRGGEGATNWVAPFWEDFREWRSRDYELLYEVMNECFARGLAKLNGGRVQQDFGGYGRVGSPMQQHFPNSDTVNMLMTMLPPPVTGGSNPEDTWWSDGRAGSGNRRRRKGYQSSPYYGADYSRIEESLRDLKRQTQEFGRFMDGINEFVFGNEIDQRREAFQRSLLSKFQALLPQLAQLLMSQQYQQQQQQQQNTGLGMGGFPPPGTGPQMPMAYGPNPMVPPPTTGAYPGTIPGMGMGVMPTSMGGAMPDVMPGAGLGNSFGVNPSANAMAMPYPGANNLFGAAGGGGGGAFPDMQPPPIGFGGSGRRAGRFGGGEGGRRGKGRGFEDMLDFGVAGGGGRRRRNRAWEDEGDPFRGGWDDGQDSPSSPPAALPRRPRPRPDGGGGGGGGRGENSGNDGATFNEAAVFPPDPSQPTPSKTKPSGQQRRPTPLVHGSQTFPRPAKATRQHRSYHSSHPSAPNLSPENTLGSASPLTSPAPKSADPFRPSTGFPFSLARDTAFQADSPPQHRQTSQAGPRPLPTRRGSVSHDSIDPTTVAAENTRPAWCEHTYAYGQWPGYRFGRGDPAGEGPSTHDPIVGQPQVRFDGLGPENEIGIPGAENDGWKSNEGKGKGRTT